MNGTVFAVAFIALYVGHHLADHVLQSDHQAAHKAGHGWPAAAAMTMHICGHIVAQGIALAALAGTGLTPAGILAALAISAATHAFIDRRWPVQRLLAATGSAQFAVLKSGGMNGPYLADQSLHIGALFVAAAVAGGLA